MTRRIKRLRQSMRNREPVWPKRVMRELKKDTWTIKRR